MLALRMCICTPFDASKQLRSFLEALQSFSASRRRHGMQLEPMHVWTVQFTVMCLQRLYLTYVARHNPSVHQFWYTVTDDKFSLNHILVLLRNKHRLSVS